MRLKNLVLTTALIALTTPAFAEGWYAGPFLLGGFTDGDNYERTPTTALPVTGETDSSGMSGGGGVWGGYDFGGYSLEASGNYRFRHDQNFSFTDITTGLPYGAKANTQTLDLMLSGFVDLPIGYKLTPYVGAGAGVVYHHLDTDLLLPASAQGAGTSDSWDFAWSVGGGFKYPLETDLDMRLDYRYVDLGSIETTALPTGTGDKLSADLTSHDFRLGLVWKF